MQTFYGVLTTPWNVSLAIYSVNAAVPGPTLMDSLDRRIPILPAADAFVNEE
jgi:hypothetical protein